MKKLPNPLKSQGFTLPSSLLIDPTHEPLNVILSPYLGITHVPSDVANAGPATMVFIELNKCFKKSGQVAEGLLPNIVWGFEQCGYDPRHTAAGLTALRSLGYIRYSDKDGMTITEQNFDPKRPCWIRYEPKFVDLFVRGLESGIILTDGVSV